MRRKVFYISDGTGITVETLGHSILSQFESVEFEQVTIPYVDTPEAAQDALAQINAAAATEPDRPIVFSTLVGYELRSILSPCNALYLELFSFLGQIKRELGMEPSRDIGKSHGISDSHQYSDRIEAVHFALDNDDGARTHHYDRADIILVGVSRSGKTPTCLYLALQFGVHAANYPITEEDLDKYGLPKALKPHKSKLFGLTIDPDRLLEIRTGRKANSRYASMKQCVREVEEVEELYLREGIPYLDSTKLSIEEISTHILVEAGLKRRLL